MNMYSIKTYVFAAIAGAVILNPFSSLVTKQIIPETSVKVAQAATSSPDGFQVGVRDHQCTNQDGYSQVVGPGGSSAATDNNAKDPDCGRLLFNPGDVATTPSNQSIYSQDFRIGTRVAESENGCTRDGGTVRWTPWASDGGGASAYATANSNVNDPDCLWIHYETRPLPAGVLIENVRAGISTGYAGYYYTPWARNGGGWTSGSRWGSGGGNISGASVVLDVRFVEIYDAEYVSDTIPDTMSQGQSGIYNVVMKNKATQWVSDESPADNCMTDVPVARGDTCSATVTVSSNLIKLRYLENDPNFTVSTNPFKYVRTVQRSYVAIDYCITGLGFFDSFVKTAQANVREPGPDDEPGGGGWTCPEWGLKYVLSGQSQNNNISVNGDGTFPLTLQASAGATNGVHTLRFQMLKVSGNESFGQEALVNVSVGNPLNCTANQTVTAGSVAHYAVQLNSNQTGTVELTMNSTPTASTNPTMSNTPLVLNSVNGYSNIANVSTTNVPTGTYNLTFNSTTPALSCPAVLQVTESLVEVDIKFNNSDAPVTLNNANSGTISWTTNGATSCTAATTALDGSPLSNSWTGPRTPANGTQLSEPSDILNGPQSYLFRLTCNNAANSRSDWVQVNVGAAPAPTVNLLCSGNPDSLPQNGPCIVPYGTAGMLQWTSTSSVSCSMSPSIGAITTNQTTPVSTGALFSSATYTITCLSATGVQATDAVTINVLANPTFNMNCSPLTAQVLPGDSTSYDIDLTSVDGFNGTVNVTGVIQNADKDAPVIEFQNNDIVPPGTVVSLVTVSVDSPPVTHIITFTGESNGVTKTCEVELIISESPSPNPPIGVVASNTGQCGTIDISWRRSPAGVFPTGFQVYRRLSAGVYEAVGPEIPFVSGKVGHIYTFTDESPLSLDSSNYYGVTAINNGTESAITAATPSPIVPVACAPNVSTSDKDIVSVQGRINKTFSPLDCSGTSEAATLPNNALFAPGDIVTFRINACNTGTQEMNKVVVADTNTNLSGLQFVDSSPGGCVTGTEGDDTNFIINMENIQPNSACSVNIRATVTAPSNPSAAIYRFQNRAAIEADGISIIVRTPPYLFSISGGVPDRTETGPQ